MADLTQTAANIRRQVTTQRNSVTAGEAITAGMPVYRKAADNEWYKAADTSAALANAGGVALTNAGDGEVLDIATKGPINLGATLTIGEIYVLSGTAGNVAPVGDLLSGNFVTILGVASTASQLELQITASGVAKP